MRPRPLVVANLDVTPDDMLRTRINYVACIQKPGGTAVLLPPTTRRSEIRQVLAGCHGLLMVGGLDYSPARYGEEPLPSVVLLDPRREVFDIELLRCALKYTNIPILGICGGCQALNLALGGSLVQDIPTALPDSPVVHGGEGGTHRHRVSLIPGSRLAKSYGVCELDVVASHHQSIKQPGRGLEVVALADDGIIEAVEMPGDRFVVGVQWHPERDYDGSKKLFQAFIRACRRQL